MERLAVRHLPRLMQVHHTVRGHLGVDAEATDRSLGENASDLVRDGSDAELEDGVGLDPLADLASDREIVLRRLLVRKSHELGLLLDPGIDRGEVHAIARQAREHPRCAASADSPRRWRAARDRALPRGTADSWPRRVSRNLSHPSRSGGDVTARTTRGFMRR